MKKIYLIGVVVVIGLIYLYIMKPVIDHQYLEQSLKHEFIRRNEFCDGCDVYIYNFYSPSKNMLGYYNSFNAYYWIYKDNIINEEGFLHVEPEEDKHPPGYMLFFIPTPRKNIHMSNFSPKDQQRIQYVFDHSLELCCPPQDR